MEALHGSHVFCLSSHVYPQFELEIHIVKSFIFYKYFDQVIWSLVVNSILRITSNFFWIFVILKLHILFGYFVDENGVNFPWSTIQEPLFSFMHGRSSQLVASYNCPARYTIYLDTDVYCMFHRI